MLIVNFQNGATHCKFLILIASLNCISSSDSSSIQRFTLTRFDTLLDVFSSCRKNILFLESYDFSTEYNIQLVSLFNKNNDSRYKRSLELYNSPIKSQKVSRNTFYYRQEDISEETTFVNRLDSKSECVVSTIFMKRDTTYTCIRDSIYWSGSFVSVVNWLQMKTNSDSHFVVLVNGIRFTDVTSTCYRYLLERLVSSHVFFVG